MSESLAVCVSLCVSLSKVNKYILGEEKGVRGDEEGKGKGKGGEVEGKKGKKEKHCEHSTSFVLIIQYVCVISVFKTC